MSSHLLMYGGANDDALEAKVNEIQKEIDRLKPCAEAERLLTIADASRPNPWAGAGERVAELRKRQASLQDESAAAKLLRVLEQYESHTRSASSAERRTQMDVLHAELQKSDVELVKRWERYYGIHRDLQSFMDDVIDRLIADPNAEIPHHSIGLPDDYIRQVARHYGLERELRRHGNALNSAASALRALEEQVPALKGIAMAASAWGSKE